MKNSMVVFFTAIMLISGLIVFTGCEKETDHNPGEENGMMEKTEMPDSPIIRSEGTDVASLDENGDGRVYQCPMHYEVISDTKVSCPMCKMDLEEYTVTEAAENFTRKQ